MRCPQLTAISLLLWMVIGGGCRTTQLGIDSTDHHTSQTLSKGIDHLVERVYIKDSTVYKDSLIERWHIRDRDRWHSQSDTLILRDTLVSKQLITQTTNRLTRWQRSQIIALWILIALLTAWTIWRVRGIIWR